MATTPMAIHDAMSAAGVVIDESEYTHVRAITAIAAKTNRRHPNG
jgi:hypothetical protein